MELAAGSGMGPLYDHPNLLWVCLNLPWAHTIDEETDGGCVELAFFLL